MRISYNKDFFEQLADRNLSAAALADDGQGAGSPSEVSPDSPLEIVHQILNVRCPKEKLEEFRRAMDARWAALPDNLVGENAICVVDTGNKMQGQPLEVAASLAVYCADHSTGPFARHYITFSPKATLVPIKHRDVCWRVAKTVTPNNEVNAGLEEILDLILATAIQNKCKPEEMPKKLYIVAEKSFEAAFETAYIIHFFRYLETVHKVRTYLPAMKEKYRLAGYELPLIVFWNVCASDCGMVRETYQGADCCLVSGFSTELYRQAMEI